MFHGLNSHISATEDATNKEISMNLKSSFHWISNKVRLVLIPIEHTGSVNLCNTIMQVEKAASTKVCSGGGNQRDKEFEGNLVEDTGGTNDRFINGEICRED